MRILCGGSVAGKLSADSKHRADLCTSAVFNLLPTQLSYSTAFGNQRLLDSESRRIRFAECNKRIEIDELLIISSDASLALRQFRLNWIV